MLSIVFIRFPIFRKFVSKILRRTEGLCLKRLYLVICAAWIPRMGTFCPVSFSLYCLDRELDGSFLTSCLLLPIWYYILRFLVTLPRNPYLGLSMVVEVLSTVGAIYGFFGKIPCFVNIYGNSSHTCPHISSFLATENSFWVIWGFLRVLDVLLLVYCDCPLSIDVWLPLPCWLSWLRWHKVLRCCQISTLCTHSVSNSESSPDWPHCYSYLLFPWMPPLILFLSSDPNFLSSILRVGFFLLPPAQEWLLAF
jgi:hypothetical protein